MNRLGYVSPGMGHPLMHLRTNGPVQNASRSSTSTSSCANEVNRSQSIDARSLLEKKLKDPSLVLTADESIALLTECVNLGEVEAKKGKNKHLTVLIGNTGAGKSLLANYLFGCEIEGKNPKDLGLIGLAGKIMVVKEKSPIPEVMPIGHTTLSTTFIPQIETKQQHTICDCPGFLDNRGFEINSGNAVNIRTALSEAASVKVIILINYYALHADKAKGLSDMLNIVRDLFGSLENVRRYKDSILLGITKIRTAGEDDVVQEGEELIRWINQATHGDEFEQSTLRCLSERLFIYDPLNRTNLLYSGAWSRETILRSIANLEGIPNPRNIFRTVLNAEDENGLQRICGEIRERMLTIFSKEHLSEEDFKTVAGYQNSLKKLQVIENQFITTLIGETRGVISSHFNRMVHRFDMCCSGANANMMAESKEILDTIKTGIGYFDREIQNNVNIIELEEQFVAIQISLELKDLERQFREDCLQQNFVEAQYNLTSIRRKLNDFEDQCPDTSMVHTVNIKELESLYNKTKSKYDENLRREKEAEKRFEEQQRKLEQLENERKAQQKIIEEQKKADQDRQKAIREAEKARKAAEDAAEAKRRAKEAEAKRKAEEAKIKAEEEARRNPPIGFGMNLPSISLFPRLVTPLNLRMDLVGPYEYVRADAMFLYSSKGDFPVVLYNPMSNECVIKHPNGVFLINNFGAFRGSVGPGWDPMMMRMVPTFTPT